MIKTNFVKEKIAKKQPVIGTWNTMGSTVVTEVLAHAGLDFLIIDGEHGPFSLERINDFVNASERHSCSPIVRVPSCQDWMILQTFDQGSHGIMIPHIETIDEVKLITDHSKYAPQGIRGFTPFSKAGGYTNIGKQEYTKIANNFTLTSIIVESLKGVNNLDAMLENPYLDVIYLGAYDLSIELGVPGDVKNKKVIDIFKKAIDKISNAGKCPGGFVAKSQDDIKWLLDLGLLFIPYQVDCGIIFDNVSKITEWFNGEIK